ncbi:MAG: outer membrane protein assembly factor BamA [Rhodothermales bacterium]|nr:outer membrane protein assembly factor BamA [Rhodothermales bacterium]
MPFRSLLALCCVALLAAPAAVQAQAPATGSLASLGPLPQAPRPLEILGITVEGVEDESMKQFVLRSSGLQVGQTVTVPGDQALAEAIRNLYRLRVFSDVKIVEERQAGDGVFLAIRVTPQPQLVDYTFSGVKKKHAKELRKQVPLFKGSTVRPSDLERSRQVIEQFYEDKGYRLAVVDVRREEAPEGVTLDFAVERGPRVEVQEIDIDGNVEVSERKLRKQLKETKQNAWWKFWGKSLFDENEYEDDKQKLLDYYREKGYFDARIVSDSVYLDRSGEEPGLVVELTVHEGPRYHIRDIRWEGNTVYTDEALTNALGIDEGEPYNGSRLQENLYGNRRSTDVTGLYMNRGHMLFRVQPEIRVAEGDSLDLVFDVFEGDVFEFGEVDIQGNTKTKEHVIRRELYTVPGQTFTRDAIQESIRRLSQLSYFDQESLAGGPGVQVNEQKKTVDLTYKVEEVGSDQLELSGTYGRFGLVLMLRFGFNNFSIQDVFKKGAWKPLPSGDGQQLSVSLQTNGRFYQSYSLSFTEPWFRGRPTPVGFSLAHSRFSGTSFYTFDDRADDGRKFIRTSANVFYQRRLKWPDDKFTYSTGVGFQRFNNVDLVSTLPQGVSQEVTLRNSIARSSLDHPMFPTAGSRVNFSVEIAPPVGNFIQYHKWRFNTDWNVPLRPKLTFNVGTDFGYIGSLTGDDVLFQRFVVGGSPFDVQGFRDNFGKDIIYMRGYPARVLGPRLGEEAVGGRILNKYTSELRWLAVQSPQLQAAPYLFFDAANTWDTFGTYNPSRLFRSAGVGARLFLPILGMLELTYGYNFDTFDPLSSRHNGERRWLFQFSIGQGFGN